MQFLTLEQKYLQNEPKFVIELLLSRFIIHMFVVSHLARTKIDVILLLSKKVKALIYR